MSSLVTGPSFMSIYHHWFWSYDNFFLFYFAQYLETGELGIPKYAFYTCNQDHKSDWIVHFWATANDTFFKKIQITADNFR